MRLVGYLSGRLIAAVVHARRSRGARRKQAGAAASSRPKAIAAEEVARRLEHLSEIESVRGT